MPHKFIITTLELFEPKLNYCSDVLSYEKKAQTEFYVDTFNHFPVVINDDGSPWIHACLYLLYRLKNSLNPRYSTFSSITSDLLCFKRFLEKENVDYLYSPKRRLSRPTIKYRMHLQENILDLRLSQNTARRKLQTVIGFYRWLISEQKVRFDYPLWNEKQSFIVFSSATRTKITKQIDKVDINFKQIKNINCESHFIKDGGSLLPYNKIEQQQLLSALLDIGNPEMTLSFLLALTTGARIQTTFTIRESHISALTEKKDCLLPVGYGTGIDSKNQKQNSLVVPQWLVCKLKVYLRSPRRLKRLNKSDSSSIDDYGEYLFVTRYGMPFYMAESDKRHSSFRVPPSGNSVRQFITNQLIPRLKAEKFSSPLRFHNLRATFGMNLVDHFTPIIKSGEISFFKVQKYIMERMGHSNIATTDRYLNYRENSNVEFEAQYAYENYLQSLVDIEV